MVPAMCTNSVSVLCMFPVRRLGLRFTLALASLDLGLCLGHPFAAKTSSQPAVHTPDRAGIDAGYVTSLGPGFVHVSGLAPRPAPAATPCDNTNTPPVQRNL